jgi:hypothetical protein
MSALTWSRRPANCARSVAVSERAMHSADERATGTPAASLVLCGPSCELIRLSTEDRPRLPFTVQAQEAEGGRTAYIKASGLSPANSSKNG